jgi:uncharacterized protein (TIGR03085 family)
MSSPAAAERQSLCELFLEVGPDSPTLAGDWTTRDLAAHLVVRERRPDAGPGLVTKVLAGYTERVRQSEVARPYAEIVERVRSGPPPWSPMRVDAVDRRVNTIEFFVHHEDVRRAVQPWSPRSLEPALTAALTELISGPFGKLLVRSCPVGLAIEPEGGPGARLKSGEPTVTIAGPIGEIVLFLYGRAAVAEVELDGEPDAVAAVRSASFGL